MILIGLQRFHVEIKCWLDQLVKQKTSCRYNDPCSLVLQKLNVAMHQHFWNDFNAIQLESVANLIKPLRS